jgi:hypothetical protein
MLKMQFHREHKKLVDSKRSGSSLKKALSKRFAIS